DIFHFEKLLDPPRPAFTAKPGFLVPAKGGNFRGDEPGIDADKAALECFSDMPDAPDIAAVEVGSKSERRVIGQRHRFFFRLETENRRKRREGFFACHFHAGLHTGNDSRLKKCAALRMALAASM